MAATIFLALGLWAVWWLLSGLTIPLIVAFGVLSVLVTVWISRRLDIVDDEAVPLWANPARAVTYCVWLAWQVVLAAWDVTKIVWSPSMPLDPRMMTTSPTQTTNGGRVVHANSITLTPGTVTVLANRRSFLIHALDQDAQEGVEAGDMDAKVRGLERGGAA